MFLKALFCKNHKPETHRVVHGQRMLLSIDPRGKVEVINGETLTTEILICPNCGDIKTLTYYSHGVQKQKTKRKG